MLVHTHRSQVGTLIYNQTKDDHIRKSLERGRAAPQMSPKKQKKKNFSYAEIDVLLNQVHSKRRILFSKVQSGISGPTKKAAWQQISCAVNAVSSVTRTVQEVKRKWFDMKLETKKRISTHRQALSQKAGGHLSDADERIASIIGETSLSGNVPEGDSDPQQDKLPDQSDGDPPQTASSSHTTTVQPSGPVQPPPSRSAKCVRNGILSEAVLEKQEKIYEAVLSINDSLKEINTTLREICNAIKSSVK